MDGSAWHLQSGYRYRDNFNGWRKSTLEGLSDTPLIQSLIARRELLLIPTMKVLSPQSEPQRTERSGSLVELKPGGPTNFFLVHDGDGNTQLYLNLARHMPDSIAVFGIAPLSIAGVPLAHTHIEDIANSYVDEVRKRQPRGPYLLGGLCAGGVIAHEMASQLFDAGEIVELLVLLDAATPQATKRRLRVSGQRFHRLKLALANVRDGERSTIGQARSVVAIVSRKLVNVLEWEIMRHAARWWVRARFSLLHQLLARQLPWPRHLPALSLRQIYESAEAYYVPKPLRGVRTVLARARHRTPILSDTPYRVIYADETLGWGTTTQDLAIVDVAGGHSTMLEEPFVQSLAAALLLHINPKSRAIATNIVSLRRTPTRRGRQVAR
jgi:thioesterase domain-containing protein